MGLIGRHTGKRSSPKAKRLDRELMETPVTEIAVPAGWRVERVESRRFSAGSPEGLRAGERAEVLVGLREVPHGVGVGLGGAGGGVAHVDGPSLIGQAADEDPEVVVD